MASQPLAISKVDERFIITRQGKDFVLYAGLLDAANREGLKRISTTLLQAPCEANNWTTMVHATVELTNGKTFDGIGDANPTNVGKNIVVHAPRMAETRAKARALRDALNIGGVAIEELGPEEDDEAPPQRQAQPRPLRVVDQATGEIHEPPPAATPAPRAAQDLRPSDPATREDLTKLKDLLRKLGKSDPIGADLTHGGAVISIRALVDEFNAAAGAR